MLQTKTSPDALDALIASVGTPPGSSGPSVDVLEFLDDCCSRFVKTPIKYFDDIDSVCARDTQGPTGTGPFSTLLMTFVEQWPFRGGEKAMGTAAEPLAQWLSKLLYLLKLVGEDEAMLTSVRDAMVESAAKAHKEVLKDAFLWQRKRQGGSQACNRCRFQWIGKVYVIAITSSRSRAEDNEEARRQSRGTSGRGREAHRFNPLEEEGP
jgi:nucleolar pre-ribosomal-associated protein 1